MTAPKIPTPKDLMWPTLEVLKRNGGSASIQELAEQVPQHLALPDEVVETLLGGGPQTKVEHRLGWARTQLKFVGAVDNTDRGVWAITPTGREIPSDEDLRDLLSRELTRRRREATKPVQPHDGSEDPVDGWKEDLLAILRDMAPKAFERLCQRILREKGFKKVEVTGRSGDGRIDGAGVLRVNLISFHVRFQCKRYAGSVGASEIRDFRGAMVGRADKGLFITTGRFTRDAAREAVRDGAPAIDLIIDGLDLCGLLMELELGVASVIRPQPDFFAEI